MLSNENLRGKDVKKGNPRAWERVEEGSRSGVWGDQFGPSTIIWGLSLKLVSGKVKTLKEDWSKGDVPLPESEREKTGDLLVKGFPLNVLHLKGKGGGYKVLIGKNEGQPHGRDT